ncbi:MAG: putative ATP-dependent RNA helicase dhr2 [Candelina submexicana]|nr:MAG: putative ATP-dependent RNA helicase dhr2 [Candelina submexicana]
MAMGEKKRKRNGHRRTEEPPTQVVGTCKSNREPSQADVSHVNGASSRIKYNSRSTNGKPKTQLLEKAKVFYAARRALPIWSQADKIRSGLREKDVMLLVGETGSGKSTQVPQFLVTEDWCKPRRVKVPSSSCDGALEDMSIGGCIAVTEPRRVAAISLARRVADEMATPLGSSSPASTVGYSVRFDNSTSPSTRIKFLTEGMLLQELLRDPWLRQYSAVIVDEIHERGANVDLVVGFLQGIVLGKKEGRGGVPLKVAVMSATADMEGLLKYFDQHSGVEAITGGATKYDGLTQPDTGSESEWSGISSDTDTEVTISTGTSNVAPKINGYTSQLHLHQHTSVSLSSASEGLHQGKELTSDYVSVCYIEGRQYPVKIMYTPQPVQDFVDAALRTIFQIHYKEPMPGDILAFLTGQNTVEALETLVNDYTLGMGPEVPKILVLPLFAALPGAAQDRVFQPAPPRTRKVILATNIAETSVTVSGVRYVIDCGKAKTKHFRTRLGLDSLLVKPISKSAAIQRKGRAGREGPGQCYRLYTEADYLKLDEANTPEILRTDLSHAILTLKARGVDDVLDFPFLAPPPRDALEKALLHLYQLSALTETGRISPIGHQIAKLPLSPSLARVLLASSEHDCVLEVIDIIAALEVDNVFLTPTSEEKKEEAELTRRALTRREGDHLTLMATVQAYAAENSDRKAWAEKHFVSHRAMQNVMDIRKQLRAQATHLNLLPSSTTSCTTPSALPLATRILKSFLTGFLTSTARLVPDGSYRTLIGNQTVAIHPSSVLFGKKVEAIVYNEFVYTNRAYARGVSAVQCDWVGEGLDS